MKILSEKDKNLLKDGSFYDHTSLLIDHFNDVDDVWITHARRYFRLVHKDTFTQRSKND